MSSNSVHIKGHTCASVPKSRWCTWRQLSFPRTPRAWTIRRTAVCMSRLLIVALRPSFASLDASDASLSNMSMTKELIIPMARVETVSSGWTCFMTLKMKILNDSFLFLLLGFFLVADFAVVFSFGGPVGNGPFLDFLTFAGMFTFRKDVNRLMRS